MFSVLSLVPTGQSAMSVLGLGILPELDACEKQLTVVTYVQGQLIFTKWDSFAMIFI